MIEELPSELQSQIEQEAKDRSMGFENKGTGFIVRTEYALGAEKYAFKWQEAEQRADRYETVLRLIQEQATDPDNDNDPGVSLWNILNFCKEALTPKQSTDDSANG